MSSCLSGDTSHSPHANSKSVFSVVLKPLPTSVATGPFVFGNTLPVCTCKPGCSTQVDDPQSFADREVSDPCHCVTCVSSTVRYAGRVFIVIVMMRAVSIWSCCVQGADRSDCRDASRTAHFEVDLAGSEEGMKADHKGFKGCFVFPVGHSVIIASVVSRSILCLQYDQAVIVPASGRLLNLGCVIGHHLILMLCFFTNQVLAQLDVLSWWNETTANIAVDVHDHIFCGGRRRWDPTLRVDAQHRV